MTSFVAVVRQFIKEDSAPTMAEYGVLLVLTALAVVGAAFALGASIGGLLQAVAPEIGNHAPPP